ncbi:hypothetical protein TCE0_015r02596, partial [Talaromyces pinophilus]
VLSHSVRVIGSVVQRVVAITTLLRTPTVCVVVPPVLVQQS